MTYPTRYQAKKHATGSDRIVKVCGGGTTVAYMIMSASQYEAWRRQK